MDRSNIPPEKNFYREALFSFLLLLFSNPVLSAIWHNNFNMQLPANINKIVCRDVSNRQLIAVGDGGFFALSNDGGHTWRSRSTPTGDNLYSVDISYFPDTLIVAVGSAGTIIFSNDLGNTWNIQNIGIDNLNTVVFDSSRFWTAGNNTDAIFWSADGSVWTPSVISDSVMNITALVPTRYGMRAAGFAGNTAYLLEYNSGSDQFFAYHTEPNIIINAGAEVFDQLVFAGLNIAGGTGVLTVSSDVLVNWSTPVRTDPAELTTEVVDINGFLDGVPYLWLLTSDGFVYESNDMGTTFTPVFQHDTGGFFRTIAVRSPLSTARLAWLGGTMGKLALLGMGIESMFPPPNGFAYAADNVVRIRFSGIASLPTVQIGVYIFSTVKGFLPFTVNYNPGDSTEVELFLQSGAEPGETLKIILSEDIREIITSLRSGGFTYNIDAKPFGPGDFNFSLPDTIYSTGNRCTNFVTGFFNDDDISDLITFSQGNLYCYAGDGSGHFLPEQIIPVAAVVSIDGNADSAFDGQLISIDLNRDGKLDLILYDNSSVNVLRNQSSSIFDFVLSDNQPGNNIVSIKPIAVDRDSTLDLLIVGDQVESRIGVNESFSGNIKTSEVNPGWEKLVIADIDRDGTEDIAALRTDNSVALRRILPWGGFDNEFIVPGNFDRIKIADLNGDGFLDLLVSDNDLVEIYGFSPPWNFTIATTLSQSDTSSISDADIFDYTGDDLNDIILVTRDDNLKIFQNQGGFGFFERNDQQRVLGFRPTGLLRSDFDNDNQIDVTAYDVTNGLFQTILNNGTFAWQPQIDSSTVSNGTVFLSWSPFPDPAALSFYRVYRDTIPGTYNFLEDVTINFYNDITVQQGKTYFYKIEAYDTLLTPSPASNEVAVSVFQTLSGLISGVLADTLLPYLVTGHLEVDQGQMLQIMPGVKMIFESAADFTVFGQLEVLGDAERFVTFEAIDDQSTWPGILLSGLGDADTVRMSWFDIHNADQALRLEDRPARIQYGGISNNNIGINVRFAPNGYLHAENIMISRNQVGIQVSNAASVYLKNVTIAQNATEGIVATNFTSFDIKNAILWGNNNLGASVLNTMATPVNIHYSTVDSLSGNFNLSNVSRLAPLFAAVNTDSMDFVPDTLSPTIDWGDPADDFSQEPLPNGGRINQGVYGGTSFAMTTHQPRITVNIDTIQLAARVGNTDSRTVNITNTGNRDLRLNNVTTNSPEFNAITAVPQILTPGAGFDLSVNFLPPSRSQFSDLLYIENNDPHYPLPGYNISLEGIGLNTPPLITTTVLLNALQDNVYIDTVRATDFDNDPVTFSAITKPAWMTINPDGSISGTPRNSDVNPNAGVQIRASDGQNGFDTLSVIINVRNVNDAPVFTTLSLPNAIEDILYSDTVRAADIDNDNLQFSGISLPAWLTLETDGALTGTPTNDDVAQNVPINIIVGDGFGAFDTLTTFIDVINTNDPPQITQLPDTIAFALIPFDYTVPWFDIDPFDSLTYTDDTPLFDIDTRSGQIRFTPQLADTGRHTIAIGVSDGIIALSDSFELDINLAPLNAPFGVSVVSGDQQLTLTWTNPANLFPTGTVISISTLGPVTHPDSGLIVYDDTTLAENTVVSTTLTKLEIGQTYHLSLFTYIEAGTRIYSDPFQTVAGTQQSLLKFDFSDRNRFVPPGRILLDSLLVTNEGLGTLILQFSYNAAASIDQWFDMDTTQHTVPPLDSIRIPFQMHPVNNSPDIPYTVTVSIDDNDPQDGPVNFNISMILLFDKTAPKIQILSQPDSLHRFTALHFVFAANDTFEIEGWEIGFPTDSLRASYKFYQLSTTGAQLLDERKDIPIEAVDFYPLSDGDYKFDLWVYDPDSNGVADADIAYSRRIKISSSKVSLPSRHWFLASLPREQAVPMPGFLNDSTARVFRWNNETQRYKSFADSTLKAGQGVWILSQKSRIIDVSQFPITQNVDSIEVFLNKGWNQIGVPTGYHIDFSKLRFRPSGSDILLTIDEAIILKKIAPAVYWYTSGTDNTGYEWSLIQKTAGQPWRGYWIFTTETGALVISRDPVFPEDNTNLSIVNTDDTNALRKISATDWQLSLTLSSESHRDAGNIIGITDKQQGLPVYEPPQLSEYCSAYFTSPGGRITRDLKDPFQAIDDVKQWQMIVSSSSTGKLHKLEWQPWTADNGVFLYLVDNHAEEIIDLSMNNSYQFKLNTEKRSFTLYGTQDASFKARIIPQEFRLQQNYPNPFNPSTTIRFGIPAWSSGKRIKLRVFNLLGQEITTLIDQNMQAGYHEISWDGKGSDGSRVASGIYFYQLTGSDNQLVRKMILLK